MYFSYELNIYAFWTFGYELAERFQKQRTSKMKARNNKKEWSEYLRIYHGKNSQSMGFKFWVLFQRNTIIIF